MTGVLKKTFFRVVANGSELSVGVVDGKLVVSGDLTPEAAFDAMYAAMTQDPDAKVSEPDSGEMEVTILWISGGTASPLSYRGISGESRPVSGIFYGKGVEDTL